MDRVDFGKTELKVTRLGLGLAEIPRHPGSDDWAVVGRVLNTALDGGINFLDTAACYAGSEDLIGRAIAHRRDEYILATKAGHVTDGASGEPWSADTIEESIDRSLKRMRTDHVDLVQLHSCGLEALRQGEVIEALVKARQAGKTRLIGFSGDNENAQWAVRSDAFDTLQTSFNLVDQHARDGLFALAEAKGLGIIVKRPFANGVWGKSASPYPYGDEYFRRAQAMAKPGPIPGAQDDPVQLAMGFVLGVPEADTLIVGTHNPDHVLSNIDMVENGVSIADETRAELHRRFDQLGADWPQLL